MGYWGWIIVAQGDDDLAAHRAVTAFGGAVVHENVMGAWREMWTSTGDITPAADIAAVVAATGAPAMVFSVMDDDCAVGDIAIPSGERWVTVFREDILAESPTEQESSADEETPADSEESSLEGTYDVTLSGSVGGNSFERGGEVTVRSTVAEVGTTNGVNPVDVCLISGFPAGLPGRVVLVLDRQP